MDAMGRPCLKCQPSSRTGENPPYGMIGGTMETSASFEARSAPSPHPTGFSRSDASSNPAIHYTARLASDPAGQMPQGEGTIINGTGSQTSGLSRWGDY